LSHQHSARGHGLIIHAAAVAFSAVFLFSIDPVRADCSTTGSAMTCSGASDGFNGSGSWALGLPGDPTTLVNNGTFDPSNGVSAIMFYGSNWSITNNGSITKDSDIGAILFRHRSTSQAASALSNQTGGSIVSSDTVGTIVTGYNNSPTYNLRINNSGSIYQSTASNAVTYPGAIFIGGSSSDVTIFNTTSGSIIGGDGSNGFHSAISAIGNNTKIVNSGLIRGIGPSAAAIYNYGGSISEILNAGTIESIGSVLPTAISLSNSQVVSIINGGVIQASGSSTADAISVNNSQINTLRNTSSIIGTRDGVSIDANSVVSNLVNGGSFQSSGGSGYGINNSGSIDTLVNAQSNLTYRGNLPTNYNILITNSTRYGQLIVTAPTGTTNFGIYNTSHVSSNTTYSNVMTGITQANFSGSTIPSGRLGTVAMITQIPWYLTNRGTDWDLVTQVTPVQSTNPVVPGSSSGTSLANAIANAAVTASNGGASPVLVNGASFSGAVQSLTSSQVDTLINAHAEGYSSNMTILMERMAGVSNAVMDRIHGAGTTRTASIKSDQNEHDKFMWAEVSGTRGFVDNYSNLAGFGYNIADIMAGFDLYRGDLGGLGIFVGGGTSRMVESNQVRQTFNSTNGYGGLYGATFLPQELRLSGSIGYMHSSTNAQRIVPDVGSFTGVLHKTFIHRMVRLARLNCRARFQHSVV